jgi:CubicO group peptidase (beta-lactamase class C family)
MVPKTSDQIIGFFRDMPLQWTPGEKYAYNNSGYFLLGVIVEKITGKKYEQALQDMILTPLGLKDTGYDWSHTIIPRRAAGYTGSGEKLRNAVIIDMNHPYAAGALYSTVEDLLKWDQVLYTEKLLPEAAKQVMWTPFKDNYAYGWSIAPPQANVFGGHKRITHGGGIPGFSAFFARLPEVRTTIVVLTNNDTASSSTVARDVMAIYYGHKYEMPVVQTVAKVDPAIFDQYTGKYELKPGFVVTISREGDKLMAQATGQPRFEIQPASETRFFANTPSITITFEKGTDGKVSHFVLLQGGREQVAKRIE